MKFNLNVKAKLASNIYCNPENAYTRDGYGKGLLELGEKNEKVIVLTADLAESTKCHWFAEKFPKRFVQVGVAEQNLIGVAAGLALEGKIPFTSSYAVFSPGRSWDQIRVSACYNNANVKIAGSHCGLNVGQDGATHQALEDIAITRCLPNLVVEAPCDFIECKKATIAIASYFGPAYLRFGRDKTATITTKETPFKIGKAEIFAEGSDVAIIACGPQVAQALIAAKSLAARKINAAVVNCHSIKPLDVRTIVQVARKCGCIVTAEEHQVFGGMGSAVAEALAQKYPVPMRFIGMQDCFGESGEPSELLEKYKITPVEIEKKAVELVKLKK